VRDALASAFLFVFIWLSVNIVSDIGKGVPWRLWEGLYQDTVPAFVGLFLVCSVLFLMIYLVLGLLRTFITMWSISRK
jgi:hypothetical protein